MFRTCPGSPVQSSIHFHRALGGIMLAAIVMLQSPAIPAAGDGPPLGHALTRLPNPVTAPDFTLLDMDETAHTLSDYRGKVIMLNFWATWCPPCRREIPSMERLYQDLKNRDFVVLGVNQWESPDHVFSYTGQLEVDPSFPILFDRESRISESFGVKGLPTTYLIDKSGNVVYKAVGGREFDHADVKAIIRELLENPDTATRP